jgi:hypothetical protein
MLDAIPIPNNIERAKIAPPILPFMCIDFISDLPLIKGVGNPCAEDYAREYYLIFAG